MNKRLLFILLPGIIRRLELSRVTQLTWPNITSSRPQSLPLHSITAVQECDTRDDEQRSGAGYKKIISSLLYYIAILTASPSSLPYTQQRSKNNSMKRGIVRRYAGLNRLNIRFFKTRRLREIIIAGALYIPRFDEVAYQVADKPAGICIGLPVGELCGAFADMKVGYLCIAGGEADVLARLQSSKAAFAAATA